eukprot:Skav213462  [mRNA]  locus=scaffold3211:43760:52633:- [translate_table: standard]
MYRTAETVPLDAPLRTGTGGSVANEPSRWLHSPSSLEASYAGLDPRRLALARQGPTPPPTPPAHRVGSLLQNIQEVPRTRPAFRPAGDTSTRGQGPADQVLAVDDEKKELLRRLQASDQRNHELELERQATRGGKPSGRSATPGVITVHPK